jgi:hypothetical protein
MFKEITVFWPVRKRLHRIGSMDAPPIGLYTRLALRRSLVSIACVLVALQPGFPAWADEPADQLERARLLREFQDAPPPIRPKESGKAPALPAASIQAEQLRARDSLHRRQFEDTQWRKLIGEQQMQLQKPPGSPAPESQWRAQSFERERQAQDLSADILRRDMEYRANTHQ